MKDLRAQPRWWQHIRAEIGGYFWLPCPICHKEFGGHEESGMLYEGNGDGTGVCLNCVKKAQKLSDPIYKA